MTPADRRARLHISNCSLCRRHERPCAKGDQLLREARLQRRLEHGSPKIAEAARRAANQWTMEFE